MILCVYLLVLLWVSTMEVLHQMETTQTNGKGLWTCLRSLALKLVCLIYMYFFENIQQHFSFFFLVVKLVHVHMYPYPASDRNLEI